LKLEDAQLCLVLDAATVPPARWAGLCREAIAGGVDLIQLALPPGQPVELDAVRDVCREDDALLVIDGPPEAAAQAGADGVHLSSATVPIGYARSVVGAAGLIGLSSRTADEAAMALDLDPDYLLHYTEARSAAALAGLGVARSVLFVAGLRDAEEAAGVVAGGVYRLAVGLEQGEPSVTEKMAGYSRLLGRCI